jgi:molybdate transport system substrate-binding protein
MRHLAALLLVLTASFAARADTLTVFAAASLRESLDAVVAAFESATGHRVATSYAASSALARQVEAGAPAAIFLSADVEWADYLEKKGHAVPGSRRELLGNDLVLVAPAASTVQLRLAPGVDVARALGAGRIALADPGFVPAGKYARAAFNSLGAWAALERRVAAVDNVRAALRLVARGEAPLGVVYRTDALAERGVRIVDTFPPGSHPPIVYPMLQLKRGASPATKALAGHLESAAARETFRRFGFRVP